MKKIFGYLAAAMLVIGVSVACDNVSNSSSSSSSIVPMPEQVYPTDTQAIANGDFEFSTFENTAKQFPDSTSISWSRTLDNLVVSADSSNSSSGIIDTKAGNDYNTMAESAKMAYTEADGVKTYYNPGTPESLNFIKAEEMFSDWPADATTESTDLPTNDDGLPMSGTKVLMIHNNALNDGVKGTAQKFTSTSSLSLAKNEFAELSVWVKTYDLSSSFIDKPGAYIAVQNTVSSAAATVMLTNINTDGNWAKYTIYLASSDFTTSSFKPRFKIVSIIPGIEARAPERTDTKRGFSLSPNFIPQISSIFSMYCIISA